jgi:hypothetical protein
MDEVDILDNELKEHEDRLKRNISLTLAENGSVKKGQLFLRGDFLQSRIFFLKSAQNLATRPSRKNAALPSWF